MIIAIDVHYRETEAKIIALAFENWTDNMPTQIYTAITTEIAEYKSGMFYKRELPCIAQIMKQIDLEMVSFLVVDGYVYLDDAGKKGLGFYVFEHFEGQFPVIGVAKSHFFDNEKLVYPVVRGGSLKPLYVTAIGVDLETAAVAVKSMAGDFRMPTLLKKLDSLTKS
jgi:deoxyinosine 3'endonuclease (endonuclease V)